MKRKWEYAQLILGGAQWGTRMAYYLDTGNPAEVDVLHEDLVPALNLLGEQGWEAFAATVAQTETIYLRRELEGEAGP